MRPSLLIFTSSGCSFLSWLVHTWLVCTITRGGQWDLIRPHLLSGVVVRGGTLKTNTTGIGGVLEVDGPQWACHCCRWHVLSQCTWLRFPADPRGHCPKWVLCFTHFPSLNHSGCFGPFPGASCSGDRVAGKALSQVGCGSYVPDRSQPLGFLALLEGRFARVLCLEGCWTQALTFMAYANCPWTQEDMISNWQPAQSLVGDVLSGADITAASCLLLLDDANILFCLHGGKGQKWQLACTALIFCNVQSFVLWVCQFSLCDLRDFSQERSFFAFLSLVFPKFRMLHNHSSVRLSSEH